jgi:hypothetical protein
MHHLEPRDPAITIHDQAVDYRTRGPAGMINSERPYPPHDGSERPALPAGPRRWLAFCHS